MSRLRDRVWCYMHGGDWPALADARDENVRLALQLQEARLSHALLCELVELAVAERDRAVRDLADVLDVDAGVERLIEREL